jgi:hypothetical protein
MRVARLTQGAVAGHSGDGRGREPRHARGRLTHEVGEVLSQVNPAARVTHTAVEVLNQVAPAARIAQAVVEVLSSTLEAPVIEAQPVIFVCT